MESLLECQICYRSYNHQDKKPISLPCGHSFCHECVLKLFKHSMIKCPFDKIQHQITVDQLPVNFVIL